MRPHITPEQRFWSKVDKSGDCWLWIACRNKNGYGKFYDGSRLVPAHRFSYELNSGPIPEGLVLDHLCRQPPCVRAGHLEAVTERENILRGTGMSARWAPRTHCEHGHPFDLENTLFSKNGRVCRTCNREKSRQMRRKYPEKMRAYDSKRRGAAHWQEYRRRRREAGSVVGAKHV